MEYKTNWSMNDIVMPEDMNRIEDNLSKVNNNLVEEIAARADAITAEQNARQTADGELQEAIGTLSKKSKLVLATLAAASWAGAAAPYTYTLAAAGVTATSNQELAPATNITQEQLEAYQGANLTDGGQAAGQIILKAWGSKPTVNIPVRVIMRGDM